MRNFQLWERLDLRCIIQGFDLGESVFSVEPTRVVATRNESDWIVFEEEG
jgi:hypothetical protein